MALVASSKLDQIAQFISARLHGNPIVREGWAHVEDGVFHVLIIVSTESLDEEQDVRTIYSPLLDAFPELLIDLWVINLPRISEADRRQLVHPDARQIDL